MSAKGKQPNYRIHVLDKTNERKGRIGAAWVNENGSISLVFDPGSVPYNTSLAYTLFINDRKGPKSETGLQEYR